MGAGLFLISLALGGQKGPPVAEPVYEFTLKKQTHIDVVKEKDRTVFLVTNPFGIGQAMIKLKAGTWPENVTFRLRYSAEKGKGFTNLENLRITTDRIYAEGNLGTSGKFLFVFWDGKGPKAARSLDERKAAGVLRVRVEARDGALEVTLPTHMLTGSNQLDVSWIDAYRN